MIRVLLIFILIFLIKNALANDKHITIASTTSTHDTGLLQYINKEFEKKYKIKVRALSLGTGQAIKVAMDGNVEILVTGSTLLALKTNQHLVKNLTLSFLIAFIIIFLLKPSHSISFGAE